MPHLSEFEDRLHPDDHDNVMLALSNHIEKQAPYDVEYQLLRNDGSYVWIHARGQALWDEKGEPYRMAGSVDDISAEKAAEAEVRNAKAFQDLILENMPDLIFVKDEEFKIILGNKAFIDLYPKDMQDKIIGYTTVRGISQRRGRRLFSKR